MSVRSRDGYDDLEPDLRWHAQSTVGDPGREERRDRLFCEFLPLVCNVYRRYGSGAHSPEDLKQAGVVGLITAIDRSCGEDGTPLGMLTDDAADLLAAMARHQVRRLPVVDDGALVGIIALADLCRLVDDPDRD